MRFFSLLPLLLLSLPAFASGKCSLTDPSLTLQSYTVDPQRELADGFSRQLILPFSISIGPDCTA